MAAVCFSLHSAGQKCSLVGLGADVPFCFMEKKNSEANCTSLLLLMMSSLHLIVFAFKLAAIAVAIAGSPAERAETNVNPFSSQALRLLLRAHLH